MNRLTSATLAIAAVASATAVCGSVYTGTTGHETPWNDSGVPWVIASVGALLAVLYGLLAATLLRAGNAIDTGRRSVRVVRVALAGDLAVLAGVFAIGLSRATLDGALAAVAGVAFVLAFLLGSVLGGLLLRRPELRTPARLMLAPLALIPLTFLIAIPLPHWADPAYAEAALYVGLALLAARVSVEPLHRSPMAKAT